MDKKQLDLNAPFFSVRRLSSPSSNVDSDYEKPSRKPKPNRQHSVPLSRSDWEPEQVTRPAAVPFEWEQIPGRAKQEKQLISQNPLKDSPRIIPPGKLLETLKLMSENEDEGYNFFSPKTTDLIEDREREDDVYVNTHEKLSASESFSWNCSDNGVDGFGKSFSPDDQTLDYLMSRFLPAAKSMVLETDQHVSKKPSPAVTQVTEPPKYVKKVYSGELRPLLEQCRFNSAISPYDPEMEEAASEFGEVTQKKSGKACRFFPKLCAKSSLRLLNPLPGPKSKVQDKSSVGFPSTSHIPRLARTSFSGPLTPSIEKQTMDAVHRKRAMLRPKEVHEIKPSQFNESLTRNGRSQGSGRVSPYRNEIPKSPFPVRARFLGLPKIVQNAETREHSSPVKHRNSDHTVSPSVAEKTLYVDWVDKVEAPRKLVPPKAEPIPQQGLKQDSDSKVDPNGDSQHSLVPPLPKSPSESWLWRKMSSRNPSPIKQGQRPPMNGAAKWETIVKTSNMHHDHTRYSKELLRVSQHLGA